jgi:hypothetical protein
VRADKLGVVKGTFDADFFVTCATVIPVLFLALVVQDGTFTRIIERAMKTTDSAVHSAWRDFTGQLLGSVAYLIWVAGALGEYAALDALYARSNVDGQFVFVTTVILLIAVAARPWLRTRGSGERDSAWPSRG